MEEDILNYSPTVMFCGTLCMYCQTTTAQNKGIDKTNYTYYLNN